MNSQDEAGSDPARLPDAEALLEIEVDRVRAALESRMLRTEVRTNIGRFVILKQLGAGAMGLVYAGYDPELDRKVAVKLLRAGPLAVGSEGRMRLVREAQALAKLAHPNVVGVHEVGEHDEQVFIAMEFVEGRTLRQWWSQDKPGWRAILEHAVQAGRGLAAAHAAGLVHRDFKPDNVIVGDDGRVRVLDFGLARLEDAQSEESIDDAEAVSREVSASPVTRTGQLIGTPAYMAPEQLAGHRADAASDQFSFCVVLWEGLFGARPFAGKSVAELAASVREARPAESSASVPRWLKRVLGRGMRPEAGDRFPAMAELLTQLERGRARARTRVIFAALGVVAVAGLGVEGSRQFQRAEAIADCDSAGAQIDTVWNDDVRARVRDGLLATEVSYAETTAEKVILWLDAHVDVWREASTEACLDSNVRGIADADSLDRAAWCLDERRLELTSLVAELEKADGDVVREAVSAAAGLESSAQCRDADVLARSPAPPHARDREAAVALRGEIASAHALLASGKYAAGLDRIRPANERASAVAWPPLSAATLAVTGSLLEASGAYAEAETTLVAAYLAGGKANAWDVAAEAATKLAYLVGTVQTRDTEGLAWVGHAELAATHAGDSMRLHEADRATVFAGVVHRAGKYAEAREAYERAFEILQSVLGEDHPSVAKVLTSIASVDSHTGAFDRATGLLERARVILEDALGADHPDVAVIFTTIAYVHEHRGELDEAQRFHERALAIRTTALGPNHPDTAGSLVSLGMMQYARGDYVAARSFYDRAIAILETTFGPEHPSLAGALGNLANLLTATEDFLGAEALFDRVLAIQIKAFGPEHDDVARTLANLAGVHYAKREYAESTALFARAVAIHEKLFGPEHPSVAATLDNIGNIHFETGAYAEAKASHARALAIGEKALGPRDPGIGFSLIGLADVALAERHPEEALPLAERAVAIREAAGVNPELIAEARFILARALWDAPVAGGRDRKRAVALAIAARDAHATAEQDQAVAAANAWLAKHNPAR